MKRLIPALLLTLVSLAAADLPKLPPETMAFIDGARGLPPEFRADTLLTLVASARIPDRAWKLELIEEAFRAAGQAPLKFRYYCHVPVDVRQCMETREQGLDALTLSTRAVQAMLALEPRRAAEMFREIVPPHVDRAACEDVITPNLADYYQTAGLIFERAFTAAERKEEEDLHFLETVISTMQSPAHVTPVMDMLSAVKLSGEARKSLLARFAITLDSVSGSDRLYGSSDWAVVPAALPETTDPRRIPRPFLPEVAESALFLPALRSYIVRQLSGPRCTDRMGKKGELPSSAVKFNALAAQLDPAHTQYQPISDQEVKPVKDDGTYRYSLPWQSPRSKALLDAQKWLSHGNRQLPDDKRFWTLEERSTPEWNAHFEDTMKLIANWKESEENSPEEYFQLSAQAYAGMALLVPPGPSRDNAMSVFLNFLETRYVAVGNRNYWFIWVKDLLGQARRTKDEQDRRWILDSLARSANPIIAFYAKLQQSTP